LELYIGFQLFLFLQDPEYAQPEQPEQQPPFLFCLIIDNTAKTTPEEIKPITIKSIIKILP